ncbi:winged helix-turn-helix domain-containing protein [Aliivibrio sifiae]|uniref:Transcriptional regulator n=1 Tax=Aliivibrio sifiae TaxID=566293 RepID=A0A2S7XJQ4_9GAMM|nr:winged helix-turn-helix domain-containing protein [Aliivibrio sifiae]PQJ93708.1 transcriptional regulator [Aliivibrio sifiae]GLR74182.1 transcriptional regulator [Aliivibrio sifiae]
MQKIIVANLVLEPETRTLRNTTGEVITLRPLPYSVFTLLLEQKGNCLDRDYLFDVCWEGAVVTDQALTNVISSLRRNLVKLKAQGIEIKTVSKVGYLLLVDDTFSIPDDFLVQEVDKEIPITVSENTPSILPSVENIPTFTASADAPTATGKSEVMVSNALRFRHFWLTKPSLISVLLSLSLLLLIVFVYQYKAVSSVPHFLVKDHYQHFKINNTDIYLRNKTRKPVNIEEMKEKLAALNPAECNAEVYIRMYDSAYDDDVSSLRGYISAKNSNRNANYSLSQFSYHDLPMIIAKSFNRAKLICE